MKAAVLKQYGTLPIYTDFAEPEVANESQILVSPKASSIKQLDISRAAGKHYTKFKAMPAVMGMDGVAELADGTRVFASAVTGMMAEKAVIDKKSILKLPDGLSNVMAAALPNVLLGSDVALRTKGEIKAGDVVFVSGATGATGMMAVQMAKFHGAAKVIATGRNAKTLAVLKKIGADQTISLDQTDDAIIAEIAAAYRTAPFNMIIDYLWGHSAEIIFAALEKVKFNKQLKYVTVGEMAGSAVSLSSQIFRSHDLQLIGSGYGSFPASVVENYMKNSLPEIFKYAAAGNIYMNWQASPLSEVEKAWAAPGRTVITIN
ncbi:zinc-binding dehydrogenase [Oenococcus sicerae]|uniref:Zinc-binding alcohol dehydrogenase family protein n=1 Tax=Oenococcus sicerae TaxID=2203724 RepID=A0AAJ1VN42_9LACO|nr:zinc-binding dehydrogenase [Oenococcus sicerae]MDN6899514.1 zinc-binding alcohol dehydrogenase family protein [Oenococcus sicerae]QAS70208.1 zinc-binding dehydrogenase [Oenococcus sicerae]VDK14009.1 hypothetical protein OAL24_00806 [Oenococcus sicerae]